MNRHARTGGTVVGLILAMATATATAGTFTWNVSSGTPNNWSTAGNWTPTGAPSGTDTTDILLFQKNPIETGYTATNDIASPFLLNTLTLGGSNLGANYTNAPLSIAGSQLTFTAGTGQLNLEAVFQSDGRGRTIAWTVSAPVRFAGNFTIGGSGSASNSYNLPNVTLDSSVAQITVSTGARVSLGGDNTLNTTLSFPGSGTGGPTFTGVTTLAGPTAMDITAARVGFGKLTGTGGLTKTGGGTLYVTDAAYNSDFTGGVTVNGGKLELNPRRLTGTNAYALGTGAITVNNNASLGLNWGLGYPGQSNRLMGVASLTNQVIVGAGGATFDIRASGSKGEWNLDGGVQLGGNLTVVGNQDGTDTTIGYLRLSGPVTLTNDVQANFSTPSSSAGGLACNYYQIPGAISGNRNLTITGPGSVTLSNGGASFAPHDFTVDTNTVVIAASSQTLDFFSGVRGNGGKVILNAGRTLTLGKGGYYQLPDFTFGSGSLLNLGNSTGGNDSWQYTLETGTLPTAATVRWTEYRGGHLYIKTGGTGGTTGDLTVPAGGTFQTVVAQCRYDIAPSFYGNLRLLGGSVLDGRMTDGQTGGSGERPGGLRRGSGTLYLGDGNAGTAETVTIQGVTTWTTNLKRPYFIDYASNTTDDGNVLLKYASVGSAPTQYFNVGWMSGGGTPAQLREGSAGTEFAPGTADAGVAAVGPASGTVFTITKPATLTTTGTVGFYNVANLGNTTGGERGALGPVVINSGGSLNLQAAGTVQASTITVNSGGAITGAGTIGATVNYPDGGTLTPGNSAGTLAISGGLALDDTTALNLELGLWDTTPGGASDFINVTGALTLDGVLNVSALTGFGPGSAPWVDYKIMGYGSLAGDLGLSLGTMPAGHQYSIWTTTPTGGGPGFVMLQVPEPSGLALLVLGGAVCLRLRKAQSVSREL